MMQVQLPLVVARPAPLYTKAYINSMVMPKSGGYRYIVQARCSLSGWPEWRALRSENARTLGEFLHQELMCRWGTLTEIVTDNGASFVAAMEYLELTYGIRHIRISAYNSQANGIVERRHRDVREALMKTVGGEEGRWHQSAAQVF